MDQTRSHESSVVPTRVAQLKVGLHAGGTVEIFAARSYEEFETRYTDVAEGLIGRGVSRRLVHPTGERSLRQLSTRLCVDESAFGGGWHMMFTTIRGTSERVNGIVEGKWASISKYFPAPAYPAAERIEAAGGALDYFLSLECRWIMLQICWLWGKELNGFIDGTMEMVDDALAETREDETGRYAARSTRTRTAQN